jgi:mono/diheme cytochrome c family protein
MNGEWWSRRWFALVLPVLAAAASYFILTLSAQAENQERGRALYENQCETCHGDWAHSRKARKAKSIADLRSRVAAWSVHSGLDWRPEEIDDVVEYLDTQFYHFK